jgi:hypothetical protein
VTAVDTTSETEILEFLDFEATPPCDVDDCHRDAAWKLWCGECGKGCELVCKEHREELAGWSIFAAITFNNTCGHAPLIVSCGWEPIS